jgi:hypothetical protein
MKKFAFALQVFGLIAALPICVVLEMNHPTGTFPGKNTHPEVKEKEARITTLVSLDPKVQNEYSMTGKIFIVSTGDW